MTRVRQLPLGDVKAAQAVVDRMWHFGDHHPVLKDLRRDVFYGGSVWVLEAGDEPLALTCGKLGKRRKNKWEPYLNWYTAYTLPAYRRQGWALLLYAQMERAAVAAGCRRVKSLAGSRAGLGLHRALGHACWGLTPEREVFVDSPLPGSEHLYTPAESPAQAPGARLGAAEIRNLIKEGLRYDQQA